MSKPVLMSLHGIRTRGEWQKRLAPRVAMRGGIPYPCDYGNASALGMFFGAARTKKLEWLESEYHNLTELTGIKRPSCIAHSFGTFLLGELLKKYNNIVFDKIILTGSILPRDYDWKSLLDAGRVISVRNELATEDPWPGFAFFGGMNPLGWRLSKTRPLKSVFGRAGSKGFDQQHDDLTNSVQNIGHSAMLTPRKFDEWLDWLAQPTVHPDDAKCVALTMLRARESIAIKMGWKREQLRMAFFTRRPTNDLVVPVDDFAVGLNDEELDLTIPVGVYAVGRAYSESALVFMPEPEEVLFDGAPRLKFVLAAPVKCTTDGRNFGVLGLDSTDLSLNISDLEKLKLAAIEASRTIGADYAKKSNGSFS